MSLAEIRSQFITKKIEEFKAGKTPTPQTDVQPDGPPATDNISDLEPEPAVDLEVIELVCSR